MRAVLFDLDGTLTDTLTDISDAMNRALARNGLPQWDRDAYRYLVGNGARILARRAVRDRQDLMEAVLADDPPLLAFLTALLTEPRALEGDGVVTGQKGIMAGTPIASFYANLYLKDLDEIFRDKGVLYARYSDDIILFTEKEKLDQYMEKLQNMIKENKLTLNPHKIQLIKPHDKWDFLGFSYENGIIDLSEISIKKIKGKIKRSSRKLRRWMNKNNANYERAISAVIRKYNRKFFMIENTRELTWQLWYFPVINTSKSLKEIDLYMQESLRYIKTGKYNKKIIT